MMYSEEASREDSDEVVLPASHPKHRLDRYRPTLQMLGAAGIVSATGMVMLRLNARPTTMLMGLSVGVILAALVSGRRGAWVAIPLAAVLGALRLPPTDTLFIDPSYRLGYGLFLTLCLLLTLYHPPRSSVPLERTGKKYGSRKQPYTEADLPTLAPPTRGIVEQQTCEVAGLDIYKWERACAHLSDVIADAQLKLQENDRVQVYFLLQHAHQLADDTRRHIQQTEIFAPPSPEADAPPSEPK